jgi:hypothetical protein
VHEGTGLGYLAEGRNKLHATLDLGSDERRALFSRLGCVHIAVFEQHGSLHGQNPAEPRTPVNLIVAVARRI